MRLDPRKTGAYIARLRRDKDWTQLALADRLHITPQAVSRWETGESFPDIELLVEMSRLFEVSTDSLLYGEPRSHDRSGPPAAASAVLEQVARGDFDQAARLAQADPAGADALIDAGPLVRPSQMRKVVEKMSAYPFTRQQVVELAPFLEDELLDALVLNLGADQWDAELLSGLAPHLGEAALDQVAEQALSGEVTARQVEELAPFLDERRLDALVGRLPEDGLTLDFVEEVAPFIGEQALAGLVERFQGEIDAEHLVDLAPFLEKKSLQRLVLGLPEGSVDAEKIVALAPHLDGETLAQLIRGSQAH